MKFRGITIHKNKTCNTWYTRYTVNGKQIYVSAKTQQDCYNKLKTALKKQEQKQLKALKEPKQKEPKSITFYEWYTKWLELYKKDRKQTTIDDYEKSMKYLKNIYQKDLNKITSIELLEILNNIEFERRKQMVYELLKQIFEMAYKNDLILKSPLLSIEKPKHKRVNGIALSNDDEVIFENYCIKNNLDIFLVCLYQGFRRGEVLALTDEDIDFKNETITINKAINSKNELDTTKNTYSDRVVPLFKKTANILKKYLNKKGRIFDFKYKEIQTPFENMIQSLFPNKKYTMHSLRHTFVTKCQEANIPLHIIQSWVGHNIGSKVTNEVYTHTRKLAELENIEKMNNYNKNY